ncbi:MAG TPA: PDZ domain-containing protein [Candidatus Limnocylindrales bacterium]|nr:PDZ domain-containing protein [Candidatus Limnocylindrales bacterium]
MTAASASARIRYTISLASPAEHRFHVRVVLEARPHQSEVTLALPAWNALYQIRDFSYRVEDVRAEQPGMENPRLPVTALDKDTWRIVIASAALPGAPRAAVVEYSVGWDDSGPFNSQLNDHHAFMNLAEILMYAPDRRSEDVEVQFDQLPANWKLSAELPSGPDPNSFVAPSYDELVDAPVEAGTFDQFEFDSGGAHFRVVVDSQDWNKSHLEDYLRRITAYELQLMGGPPFKEYTFFFHIGSYLDVGGGGMEHANCTAISAGSTESAANVAAHEFFHVWNVKRIRPQTLEPLDYSKEMYTRALWFAEGVTSAYSSYTLERVGLWPKDEFYRDLETQINELESRPAHKWQSAEESSLDAWLEKYDAYNFPDRSISYYNKGQILGVMLDLAIRDATGNRKSLDDVMRLMNDEYAKQHKFYNDSEGVRAAVEQVTGKSFEDFFRRYVAGVDEIPYNTFLNAAGLDLKLESAKSADLGFSLGRAPGGGLSVRDVDQGSAAASAGLHEGDVILQLDGHDVPRGRRGFLRDLHPGDTLTLHVNRGGQLLDVSYVLGSREEDRYSLAEIPNPSDRQRRIRNGWLRGTTD